MFKIYINNNCVETQYHANHISRLHHLMDVDENIASNRGICQGLFPIKPSKIGPLIDNAVMGANEPRKLISKQDTIHLKGYLNADIATSNKWLIYQCNVRVVLESTRDSKVINAVDGAVAFAKNIALLKLNVNRIKTTRGGFLNTTKWLQSNNLEYIMKRHIVHTEILAAGQNSLTISRPF